MKPNRLNLVALLFAGISLPVIAATPLAGGQPDPPAESGAAVAAGAAERPGMAGPGAERPTQSRRHAEAATEAEAYSTEFGEAASDLASAGTNPFCVLQPGFVSTFEGKDGDEHSKLVITVTSDTRVLDGVETRVVEELETVDGKLKELSINYFAISKRTNNVYYFGEDTAEYQDGKIRSTSGTWHSGVKGARYGLYMPATPLLGSRYHQEIAPGEAMDRAEVVACNESLVVPAGSYVHVLVTLETSPLEKGVKEKKFYAAGVGLLKDGALTLVSAGMQAPRAAIRVEGKPAASPSDSE